MNKHVVKYYFTHVEGENWKCRCGRNRKQKLKKGFSNLISHIQVDHPNWQTEVPLGTGQQTIANLAVNMFMNNYEDLLDKIHATMLKMSSLKKSGALRKLTPLRPVLRNKTRWSATFEMVKRYTVLQQFIPQTDLDLMPYLLRVDENSQVQGLLINLEQIESVTKVLQEEDQPVTLSDIRDLFDALIEEFPAMKTHLAKNAVIVANRCFEDAVVLKTSSKNLPKTRRTH